jgi:hypothetical protein
MKPRFKVKLSRRAERQIDRARDWRMRNLGPAADDMDELGRRTADLASGRVVGIPHADVQRGLEELRR